MDAMSLKILDKLEAGLAIYEIVTNESGNQDMKFVFANRYYATNLLGQTPESIVGGYFSELASSDMAWIPIFADVAFGKREAYPFESYSVECGFYAHSQLFSPKYGQVAIVVHNRDQFVKDELMKEREERGTRRLIGTMAEGLCYGAVMYDAVGNVSDINCIVVNEAFEKFMDVRVDSLQGNNFFELYPNQHTEDLFEIDKAMKSKETVTYIRDSFSKRIMEITLYPHENDQIITVIRDVTERIKAERELANAHETIVSSIEYASTIQQNILPTKETMEHAFTDHSVIWKPRDIVGGDVYWVKTFKAGTVLCVCDCTGHGTPGALLTMLVSATFNDYVNESNCSDTSGIIWNLDQKLMSVFSRKQSVENHRNKDGCDLAVLFIAKDGTVIISSAHMHVYICDGKEVIQLKGQHVFVGEGNISSKEEIESIQIPLNPDNKFYVASDGMSDQPGGPNSRPYGYREFKKIILEHHSEKQSVISARAWEAFEVWRGEEARVDDFELISFKA